MKLFLRLLCAFALVVGVSVPTGSAAVAGTPLKVVATFSVLSDMVREIGGDKIEVKSLVGPGGDAHVYEPTPADVGTIAKAGLVVVNGLGMEGWMDRLVSASATKAPIVVASQGVKPIESEERTGGEPGTDPHAWQDLSNGRIYAANIAEGLAKADPGNAAYYRERAGDYAARLASLDSWVRAEIAKVPPDKRRIITSHDAFGYFGKAYGVEFLAPVGISTDSEPSAAAIGQLERQIKREKIKTLFLETMTDPRLVSALAKETGASVGDPLYSDSLSPANGPAATYEAMFRHNLPLFVRAMMKNG